MDHRIDLVEDFVAHSAHVTLDYLDPVLAVSERSGSPIEPVQDANLIPVLQQHAHKD